MKDLQKVIDSVNSHWAYQHRRCTDLNDDLAFNGNYITREDEDDILDEITELERDINNLDDDWVFLENCNLQGKILDEARYNGIKGEYKL